jgi:hypothetical protein
MARAGKGDAWPRLAHLVGSLIQALVTARFFRARFERR